MQLERPLVVPSCPLDLLVVEVEIPFNLLAKQVECQVHSHLLERVQEQVRMGDARRSPEGERVGVALPGFDNVFASSLLTK